MEKQLFLHRLDEIFAAFGKKYPERRIEDAIWRRICDLPDDFMAYAQARLEELDKLPGTLGRYLASEIWPEYQARHRFKGLQDRNCPECRGIGAISAWDKRGYAFSHRCICNGGTWTRERLLESGMQLEDPAFERCKNSWTRSTEVEAAIAATLGKDFPIRERHAEFMQGVEYD